MVRKYHLFILLRRVIKDQVAERLHPNVQTAVVDEEVRRMVWCCGLGIFARRHPSDTVLALNRPSLCRTYKLYGRPPRTAGSVGSDVYAEGGAAAKNYASRASTVLIPTLRQASTKRSCKEWISSFLLPSVPAFHL